MSAEGSIMRKSNIMTCAIILILFLTNFIPISSQDAISKDFFIDQYTGKPNCMIVIGENAAASDAMSAAWIAAQLGTMAYYEETKETYITSEMTYYTSDQIYNKQTTETGTGTSDRDDMLEIVNSNMTLPFSDVGSIKWNYDVYIDPYSEFDNSENWLKDTGFSYESISLDLSIQGNATTQESSISSNAAIVQKCSNLNTMELSEGQKYPAVYPRYYWGINYEDKVYDPLGGLEYRVVVYGMTEQISTKRSYGILVDPKLNDLDNETLVDDLYASSRRVFFLGNSYNCLKFGTDDSGYDYMLYGLPQWGYLEMIKGDEHTLDNGWSFLIKEIDIYDESIDISILSPEDRTKDYSIPQSESLNIYENILPGVRTTILSLQFENISIKRDPSVSCTYYNLIDYGSVRETIYGLNAPYIIDDGMEWHLDIVPCDDIQEVDLDNDRQLYFEGNPSFDFSDSLKVYNNAIDEKVCSPYLELWLATPIENIDDKGAINISLSKEEGKEYFHVEVSDKNNGDYRIDDYIKVGRVTKISEVNKYYIDVDNSKLAISDKNVTVDAKSDYNLILVGGPVANSVVNELIILGATSMEFWTLSKGDYVIFNDAFVNGKDVIVVAGKDREATNKAAKSLLNLMTII